VAPCRSCAHLLTLVPPSRIFLPWRWRRYGLPKRRFNRPHLHGATPQKTAFFILQDILKINFCSLSVYDKISAPQLTITSVHTETVYTVHYTFYSKLQILLNCFYFHFITFPKGSNLQAAISYCRVSCLDTPRYALAFHVKLHDTHSNADMRGYLLLGPLHNPVPDYSLRKERVDRITWCHKLQYRSLYNFYHETHHTGMCYWPTKLRSRNRIRRPDTANEETQPFFGHGAESVLSSCDLRNPSF
jgi:hypothetical protein